jgi:hypothetical protein
MKLRKSTGYTFINCKKALEKCDNDITKVNIASFSTVLLAEQGRDGCVNLALERCRICSSPTITNMVLVLFNLVS